jgi:hypothetical protein
MFNSKNTMASLVSLFIFSVSSHALAQSVAQAGQQCSGVIAVPSFSCMNAEGGEDVRLYIMEFQDCKDGNITNLDKSITGYVFSEENDDSAAAKVDVVFSGVRTHFDDRVDDLTLDMPKSAVIQTAKSKYVLDITTERIPSYEGANINDDYNYKGSFKRVDKQGATLSSGNLACFVSR